MPVPINFSKAKAEYLLDCLCHGKPIEGVGTHNDFLALAGACLFAAMSHGPVRLSDREWSDIPLEHREAGSEQFLADLRSAVAFYAELTMRVKDGSFDESFESEVRAIVYTED